MRSGQWSAEGRAGLPAQHFQFRVPQGALTPGPLAVDSNASHSSVVITQWHDAAGGGIACRVHPGSRTKWQWCQPYSGSFENPRRALAAVQAQVQGGGAPLAGRWLADRFSFCIFQAQLKDPKKLGGRKRCPSCSVKFKDNWNKPGLQTMYFQIGVQRVGGFCKSFRVQRRKCPLLSRCSLILKPRTSQQRYPLFQTQRRVTKPEGRIRIPWRS